jgi:hypothetical protein
VSDNVWPTSGFAQVLPGQKFVVADNNSATPLEPAAGIASTGGGGIDVV